MRTHYLNGNEIGLQHNGCDGCSPSMVNGRLCHEAGCPDAWRDRAIACHECGCDFYPENRHESVCPGCADNLTDVTYPDDDYEVQ